MKRLVLVLALLPLVALVVIAVGGSDSPTAEAQQAAAKKHLIAVDTQNRAVKGYDVVAYFQEANGAGGRANMSPSGAAQSGTSPQLNMKPNSRRPPHRYAPQYGGYCGWGVSAKNDLFKIDRKA